ncbi:MAG: DUF3955 domain-containing protein [Chloroflexi bacterium]|nr:DUF3955 domain-containing protein [Chloroflexota bacterium]MBI3173989.1 DUF3955 domain-containing protein [Chloroflexota bacterium]
MGVLLFVGAVVCLIAFNMIGSEIDSQGVLHEPFFLIPLFWLLIISSLIAGGVNVIARFVQAKGKKAISQ